MQEIMLNYTGNKLQGTVGIAEPRESKSICIPAWLVLDNMNNCMFIFIDKYTAQQQWFMVAHRIY